MKTLVLGFALQLLCATAFSQDQKTSIENVSVITTAAGTSVQLTWKKGDENISYFIVERSTDGIDFKQCGVVFLSEDPAFIDYKFKDKVPSLSNGLLYRIGIVNMQRRLSYLPVKRLAAPETL